MKKNDLLQVKASDIKELKSKAVSLRKEIEGLVVDKNTKKLKDLKMISKKKKDLAQVLTVLKQKQDLVQLETKVSDENSGKGEKRIENSVQGIVNK